MYAPAVEFSRKQLRNPSIERVIQGVKISGRRALSIGLLHAGVDGLGSSGVWIRHEGLPLVARAIESARQGRQEVVGVFQDGTFAIRVSCGLYASGDPGVYLQRLGASGEPVGRSVPIAGPELDALDKGLAWLAESFAA